MTPYPGIHRQTLLPQEVRRQKDPGSLLVEIEGRDGSRGPERRGSGSGEGDDATGTRLAVATP